jgi:hypothetical protein
MTAKQTVKKQTTTVKIGGNQNLPKDDTVTVGRHVHKNSDGSTTTVGSYTYQKPKK